MIGDLPVVGLAESNPSEAVLSIGLDKVGTLEDSQMVDNPLVDS